MVVVRTYKEQSVSTLVISTPSSPAITASSSKPAVHRSLFELGNRNLSNSEIIAIYQVRRPASEHPHRKHPKRRCQVQQIVAITSESTLRMLRTENQHNHCENEKIAANSQIRLVARSGPVLMSARTGPENGSRLTFAICTLHAEKTIGTEFASDWDVDRKEGRAFDFAELQRVDEGLVPAVILPSAT
ncbi:hypothetical protein BDR07DRAFT_415923 [Suillus spraguei]|nr:hypothetical protein BDR07DRAFT_415923 [Suillus spraguei]